MNLAQFQLIEQTNVLYRKITFTLLLTSLSLCTIAVITLWFHHNTVAIITWYIISAILLFIRYYNKQRFLKNTITLKNYKKWLDELMLLSLFLGLMWGLMFFISVTPNHLLELLVLTTIYFALASTSSSYLGVYFPAYLVYTLPLTLLLVIKLLLIGSMTYYIFASLIGLYYLLITSLARNTGLMAQDVSELTFHNNNLYDDVVAQKEVAEKAVLAKNQFLAAASHDLRQPLHAQGLFITALEYSQLSPEANVLAEKIKLSSNSLNSLLNGLLDISSLDSNSTEYNPSDVELSSVLKQIHQQYFDYAAENESELELLIHDDLVVTSDETLLSRLIRNLVDNAVKFTHNGKITITTKVHDSNVLLSIADTGKGIPLEQQENIFTEFTQLDNPERDRQKGLGLGLAIVQRISFLMGIPLRLESSVGKGSTFTLSIPLSQNNMQYENIKSEGDETEKDSLKGHVIVVIDDESVILDGMRMIIERWQATVITAENTKQAIDQLDHQGLQPNLIISDLRLRDGKNGIQAIEKLRTEFNSSIKAILITGDTAQERIDMAAAAGLTLLHKPVNSNLLRETINHTLEN